jgi:hypothetical protein
MRDEDHRRVDEADEEVLCKYEKHGQELMHRRFENAPEGPGDYP